MSNSHTSISLIDKYKRCLQNLSRYTLRYIQVLSLLDYFDKCWGLPWYKKLCLKRKLGEQSSSRSSFLRGLVLKKLYASERFLHLPAYLEKNREHTKYNHNTKKSYKGKRMKSYVFTFSCHLSNIIYMIG